MIEKFKSLTLRKQTFLIQVTTFSLVLIIFTAVLVPFKLTEIEIIKQSSHEALLKSNDVRISQLSKQMNILINRAFEQVNLALNKVQLLNFNEEMNSSFQIRDCWAKQNNSGIILAYCYNNDEQIQQNSDYYNNYAHLLNQMDQFLLSLLLDQLSQFQIIYRIQKPHLTSLFTLTEVQSNFNVETRPYYQETIKQNNTRYIVSPYINQAHLKLSIMIIQTIYDKQNNPEFKMGIGLQLDNFYKYLSLNNVKFVLCTLQGMIVISNLDNDLLSQQMTSKIYLFEQTTFPFSIQDWNELTLFVQNKTYQSNCKSPFIKFCRNLNGSDIQIETKIIQQKFIQIMYKFILKSFNDLSFTQQENEQMEYYIKQLIQDVTNLFLIFFPCSFCLLLLSSIILAYLTKPAVQFIQIIDQQIKSSYEYNCDFYYRKRVSIFKQLSNSYKELNQRNISQKNKSIRQFNKYQYPRTNKSVEFDSFAIQSLNNSQINNAKLNKILIKQINQE